MNFSFNKGYHVSLKEDVVIDAQRIKYIKQVQKCRNEGRAIYYQDETWVNKNMTPLKGWLDENGEGVPAFSQGKDMRSIISHIGSQDAFLEGAMLIYRGENSLRDPDYHTDTNSKVFQD